MEYSQDHIGNSPAVEIIMPKYISSTDSHLEAGEKAFESRTDRYHIIKVDDNGNEITGSDFSISAQGYQRQYAHNPSFKVKKKQ